MTTRARIDPIDGQLVYDPNGDLKVPIVTALRHRLLVQDGTVIDLYDGISDEQVQAWDAEHPDQITPSGRYLNESAERAAREAAEAEAAFAVEDSEPAEAEAAKG